MLRRLQATYCRGVVCLWVAAHCKAALGKFIGLWLSSAPPPTPCSLHPGSCRFTMTKAAVLGAISSV